MAKKTITQRRGKSRTAHPKSPTPNPKSSRKYVYFFGGGKADGNRNMKDLLGGKGAGLAEMTNAGLPVPPGFTISTRACNLYMETGGRLPAEVDEQIEKALARLEQLMGKKLGDPADPLLVSAAHGDE